MSALESFVKKVPGFYELSSSEQIDFLSYFLLLVDKQPGIKAKNIELCFDDLHLTPYSNVGAYLIKFSKRGNGKKYLRRDNLYFLERSRKEEIDALVKRVSSPEPSDDLFPIVLLENTRGYILNIGRQACVCYDLGLYDASLVMLRKLLETLIIECFERHRIEETIKGKDGHYFFLSDLVGKFLNDGTWAINRNTSKSLPKIKTLGDLSAHNRRYSAKKPDIDKIKDDLRIVIEDLIHLIDYPNWTK